MVTFLFFQSESKIWEIFSFSFSLDIPFFGSFPFFISISAKFLVEKILISVNNKENSMNQLKTIYWRSFVIWFFFQRIFHFLKLKSIFLLFFPFNIQYDLFWEMKSNSLYQQTNSIRFSFFILYTFQSTIDYKSNFYHRFKNLYIGKMTDDVRIYFA